MAARRRVRLLVLIPTLTAMWSTIRHLFSGIRPFDWMMFVIELLVLLALLWFEGLEVWHQIKLRKRVSSLIRYMDAGQTIQNNLHTLTEPLFAGRITEETLAWMMEANMWSQTTREFLALHSKQASAAFLLVVNMRTSDRDIYTQRYGTFHLSGEVGNCYQILLARLDNLRRIMERPEAYF
jgi:hypothetical protein